MTFLTKINVFSNFILLLLLSLGISLPRGLGMLDVWLLGFIAAIGLTVSLFVAGEAFRNQPQLRAEAKMGALLSVLVGLVAVFIGKTCGSTCITEVGSDGGDMQEEEVVADEEDEEDDDEELGKSVYIG